MKEKLKNIYQYRIVTMILIMVIGIFLRTYKHHDWLLFEFDQVRDATLVEDIVENDKPWPDFGPTMRASSDSKDTLFKIGPIYYYFQIISAEIFGAEAQSMAYPDLLFSILSIPLFYYFLKRYFSYEISIILTFLYSVSFFSIKYSRFAWNPNPIPFFSILFILAMVEFLEKKERVSWWWVLALGISLGVGVQLHASMLLLFGALALLSFGYMLKLHLSVWKKIIVVIAIAALLNTPQILSEFRTGFQNSRFFFNSSVKDGGSKEENLTSVLAESLSCVVEANMHMISSYGGENCNYSYVKVFENNKAGKKFRESAPWSIFFFSAFFSIVGYLLLFKKWRDGKRGNGKYFLSFVLVYYAAFFVITIPIIGSGFKEFRHYLPVFFIPYFFLGIFLSYFLESKRRAVFLFTFMIAFLIFLILNITALTDYYHLLLSGKGNDGHSVYLGETEELVDYMIDKIENENTIYLASDKLYSGNIFLPGGYVAKKRGITIKRVLEKEEVPGGELFFYVDHFSDKKSGEVMESEVVGYKDFGEITLYELRNK